MKHLFFYLYLAFVISLSILVLLSVLFTQQLGSMIENTRSVENSYKTLYSIQLLNSYIKDIELSARGYLITRDSLYLSAYDKQWKHVTSHIDTLEGLIETDGKQRNKLALIHSNIRLRGQVVDRILKKAGHPDTTGLSADLERNDILFNNLRTEVNTLEKGEVETLNAHKKKKKLYEEIAPDYLKGVLLFTIFIIIPSFFFLNKELRRRLKYQKEIEKKIRELRRSNHELEQIAHVASHDLQEPLRKIRTFSNRLLTKHAQALNDESKLILNRMDASANRMHELINEVVNFTNLIHSNEIATKVELKNVVESVINQLQDEIHAKNAVIHCESMPVISGFRNQLILLFKSLIDNSLKYSREGIAPHISIASHVVENEKQLFHHVSIEDNGIGFENEFAERIFILFQRLHTENSGYKGKGIGLSIVQRVMVNHNGSVRAKGSSGNGATFTLHFPVQPL